ncbi:autotransporter domain-containing protein [Devosia riboflavina]|nr:autotransporter domain-containing protein [Devosia riboflavina]
MATTALVAAPKAEAQSRFDRIYGLPNEPSSILSQAMSGNGAYVVGLLQASGSGLWRATRWDSGGNAVDLGADIGANSYATGVSWDGSVVVGYSNFISMPGAFRWTEDGGLEYIGSLGGNRSMAYDVSNDGRIVVGFARRGDGTDTRFVWIKDATTGVVSNPQMHEMLSATGAINVTLGGISGNGRYTTGQEYPGGTPEAYRYDISGIQGGVVSHVALGSLGGWETNPYDISDDGTVIVGAAELDAAGGGHLRAFRWVEGATGGYNGGSMYELGTLGGDESAASAVSGDGRVVVGRSESAAGDDVAFRWEEDTGMLSVADWLRRAGVSVDYTLTDAQATNSDGSLVTGTMLNDDGEWEIYIARVIADTGPNPGSGIMNVAEYQSTLYGAAGIANAGEFLTWLPMNGAHHRPLMLTPDLSGDMCAWATGDFAHYGQSGANLALAEAGGCVDLAGGAVRLGGAVGTTASWQALSLGGAANMVGQYVLGEVDWQPDGTPLLLSVTGMLGGWNAKVDRAYSNGAATAMSSGQTNAMGGVVRVRADWLEAAKIGNTSFNPWASVSFGALHVDGYSESGGPFPARFAAQNLGHTDIRVGVTAVTEFSKDTRLSTTLELAHRTGTAASAVGQVDGLFSFSLGGGTYGQTWGRLGLELDHRVNDAVSLSTSVHLATNGRDPTVAISAGIKGAF